VEEGSIYRKIKVSREDRVNGTGEYRALYTPRRQQWTLSDSTGEQFAFAGTRTARNVDLFSNLHSADHALLERGPGGFVSMGE
jgi:hypothetical protein